MSNIVKNTKLCTKCKRDLSFSKFCKNKTVKSGLHSYCKDCTKGLKKKNKIKELTEEEILAIKDKKRLYYLEYKKRPVLVTENGLTEFKEKYIKQKYNLTPFQYNSLLDEANGLCAICKKPEVLNNRGGRIKSLSIDHCHKTGKVRGLLCTKCNSALGLFDDNINVLNQAINYLNNG